jgi:signal peptidase I
MGDNRTNSLDGRYWGLVHRSNLIGRPLFVYWSFKTPNDQMYKTSLSQQAAFALHQFTHFVTDTRWNRTFHPIN